MKSQCLNIGRLLLALVVFSPSPGNAVNLKYFDVSRPGVIMVADPRGALWYTHGAEASDGISRVSMSGKQEIIEGPGSPIQPRGIALADNGDLWLTDSGTAVIRRLSKAGAWEAFPIPVKAWHITKGPDGNLWFVGQKQVGRVTPSGSVKMFSVGAERSRLQHITSGPDGKLWIADAGADAILSMDLSGNVQRFPLADAGSPLSITAGPDGHLWFTEPFLNRIGRMSIDGQLTEIELPRPLSAPVQIIPGPDGNLWFTESDSIGRITPQGVISELEVMEGGLGALSFGPDGNLWGVYGYASGTSKSKMVRMTLGGTPVNGPCTASDTILCIDDTPGDRRFQVEVEYETAQAGGLSGKGKAIPLSSLGVARGGLFWFFSEDNPELVVKILNGCASNQKYWVFLSGGTNVGLIITVSDTVTGEVHTYYNRENTPFAPIQDTSALSCGS